MIRRAIEADADQIVAIRRDYYLALGPDVIYKEPTRERALRQLASDQVYAFLDDAGPYCMVTVYPDEERAHVDDWHPRSMSRAVLVPVLAAALRAIVSERGRTVLPWRIEGVFEHGKSDTGEPDRGEGIGNALGDFLRKADGTSVVRVEDRDPALPLLFHSTIGELLDVFRKLGV